VSLFERFARMLRDLAGAIASVGRAWLVGTEPHPAEH
jgi:hypothetical protein